MTDGNRRDQEEASKASDSAARARRIQGVIEIAMSDLEREHDVGTAELAALMMKTQMNRVLRLEGAESYAAFIDVMLDVLAEQKRALTLVATEDARRWAN